MLRLYHPGKKQKKNIQADLKKIPRRIINPIILFLIIFTAAYVFPDTEKFTIAVIPFNNISGNSNYNWLSDGIGETLTMKLGSVEKFQLVERMNLHNLMKEAQLSMSGITDSETAIDTGKILNLQKMVIGSYQIFNESIRIFARVVDSETGTINEQVEVKGELNNIFDLQDDLAFKLISQFGVRVSISEKIKIADRETDSIDAYKYFNEAYNFAYGLNELEKNEDKAVELYLKTIEIDKNYFSAHNNLGTIYYKRKEYEKSITYFKNAIKIKKDYYLAINNLASAYSELGKSKEAIKLYQKAIDVDPENFMAYYNLGSEYYNNEMFMDAIRQFKKATEMNSDLYYPYYSLAICYLKLSRDEHSIRYFK